MKVEGIEISGPLYHGVSVEDRRGILVAAMWPAIGLAARDPRAAEKLLECGFTRAALVNECVRQAQIDDRDLN